MLFTPGAPWMLLHWLNLKQGAVCGRSQPTQKATAVEPTSDETEDRVTLLQASVAIPHQENSMAFGKAP